MKQTSLSRRTLLASGGALVVGVCLPLSRAQAKERAMLVENAPADFAPNAYIRIGSNGPITFILPNVEMGQGIYTGAVAMIAEELDVDLDQIQIEAAPPDKAYIVKELGTQATGGSTSTMIDWKPLRMAGAKAKYMLVKAAADEWGVNPASCYVKSGVIYHDASGQSIAYAAIASAAAKISAPDDVTLKSVSDFRLLGKPIHRIDSPIKVRGEAIFGIDVSVPGMRVATVKATPVVGGKLLRIDNEKAVRAMAGVEDIIKIDDAVCVVAEHYWAALKGLQALNIIWEDGTNSDVNTSSIFKQLYEGLSEKGIEASKQGNAIQAIAGSATRHKAVYQQPLLAHAPMEPINCTVHVTADKCEIWVGSQVPLRARDSAAEVTGLPKEKVIFHGQYIGGGFGRRLEHEYVTQAVKFAKQVKYPIKIIWSREEDITHDRFRPPYVDHIEGGLDHKGEITGLHQRLAGPSVAARWMPDGMMPNGMDPDLMMASTHMPYDLPSMLYQYVRKDIAGTIPAWWRGVGGTRGLFVIESFVDELAEKAAVDPLAFRQKLVGKNLRARKVLDTAAEKAEWGKPLPKGHGRGIALQFLFGSYLATIIEVSMMGENNLKVIRAVSAIDCGEVVNPDQVVSQLEGGLIFGISTALYNEVTLKGGKVEQKNFNNYRMLRMNEAPKIDIVIVPSNNDPGGVGETGTAAAAPALANAMAAASKKRYRVLPLLGSQNYSVEGVNAQ